MDTILLSIKSLDPLAVSLLTVGIILFICVATWCYSWLYSFPGKPYAGYEPPLVPYYFPYLGHVFQFLSDPGSLVQRYRYFVHLEN
jgi:hypothetical protein